jgi:hypothetical protein
MDLVGTHNGNRPGKRDDRCPNNHSVGIRKPRSSTRNKRRDTPEGVTGEAAPTIGLSKDLPLPQ